MQRINEYDVANFEYSTGKSPQTTIIDITLFKGRTRDTKKNFYREVTNNLHEKLGIPINDIIIVLNEVPLENCCIKGGLPADEVNLGFIVER